MKKTVKKTEALDALANRLRAVLRRETKDIIEVGNLLIESRKLLPDHGKWQSWLAEAADVGYRAAHNYVSAAAYVARKGESD
jgi:hypothetical protein